MSAVVISKLVPPIVTDAHFNENCCLLPSLLRMVATHSAASASISPSTVIVTPVARQSVMNGEAQASVVRQVLG